jgi:hypothetical protein
MMAFCGEALTCAFPSVGVKGAFGLRVAVVMEDWGKNPYTAMPQQRPYIQAKDPPALTQNPSNP